MLGGHSATRGGAIFAPLIAASILFAATAANAADKPIVVGASISQTGPLAVDAATTYAAFSSLLPTLMLMAAGSAGRWISNSMMIRATRAPECGSIPV